MRTLLFLVLIAACATSFLYATTPALPTKDEVLSHYGILHLSNQETSQRFASRLRAKGDPLFLIRDFRLGVQQNDIIRFKDKVILIDANVWETMKSENILQQLTKLPVVHLQAKSSSAVWSARGKQVTNIQEQKGYFLGSEFLNILEAYFNTTPTALEIIIRFENEQMVLMAPKELMEAISFTEVIARKPNGKPQIISLAPKEKIFLGAPFMWRAWAINPSNPQSELHYFLAGSLPRGLSWSETENTISGIADSLGSWPISIIAQNESKAKDTLHFTLTVRKNQPPLIANTPTGEVIEKQAWHFKPLFSDPDHATEELSISTSKLPKGMTFDSDLRTFYWNVPKADTVDTEKIRFSIKVKDPMGDSAVQTFKIQVLSAHHALKARGINLNLPLDTLVQGRTYSWPDSIWVGEKLTIDKITGSDSTLYQADSITKKGRLILKPQSEGSFSLTVAFYIETSRYETTKTLTVLKNHPPEFVSALETRTFIEEQNVQYRPAVADKENDSIIALYARDGSGSEIPLIDGSTPLVTNKEGNYSYKFSAIDAQGNTAHQRISYTVIPKDRKWVGVDVDTKILANRTSLHIAYRNGSSRFGLFIPDAPAIDISKLYERSAPFVTVEANLLGEHNAALGTFLNVGGGVTFRIPKPGLITGGLLITTSGRYTNRDGEPWIFEYNLTFFAKQAYVFTDTTGFSQMDSTAATLEDAEKCYEAYRVNKRTDLLQACVDKLISANDSIDASQVIPENIKKALDEYNDDTNMNLLIQLETWYPVKYGFWAGALFWKDAIIFNDKKSETRAGFGIRHIDTYHLGSFDISYETALRFGWAGDGSPLKILWDLQLHFGR